MKKNITKLFLLLVVSAFFSFNCTVPTNNGENGGGGTTVIPPNTLIVHYQRNAGDYENYTLWLWHDTTFASVAGWPEGLDWDSKDDFGAVFKVPLKTSAEQVGFVPVNKTIGDDSKDAGDHVFQFVSLFKEIWVFQGDANCYISKDKEKVEGIIGGYISSETEMVLKFAEVTALTPEELVIVDKNNNPITISSIANTGIGVFKITIPTKDPVADGPYSVSYGGKTIVVKVSPFMLEKYTYDGNDLGPTYNSSNGSTTFKLWSPTASDVKIVFYDKINQATKLDNEITMSYNALNGLWSKTVNPADIGVTDLKGYFYQYKVTNNGVEKICLDPYAKSMAEFYVGTGGTVSSSAPDKDIIGKAAIIDLADTGTVSDYAPLPVDWKREDVVIYEVHVRDFTSYFGVNPSGAYPSEVNKPTSKLGTYKAFIENLDYIKNMGYTHIQFLPVMNYFYGDESNKELETTPKGTANNYNWGFDPHHYFTPEGMYATDSKDPIVRVKELKELIQAVHDKGMGVILDVVYTHMSGAHFLADIVPEYYFFMQNGQYVGAFGNNLATTRTMSKKLMIDSLLYWTSEYKVDGFRHDMMGDGDHKAIMEAYDMVAAVNPKTIFIGEGWTTFTGENDGAYGADQNSMNEMNDGAERVAVFSDEFRNLMKSGFGAEGSPMFISGGAVELLKVFNNVKGQPSNFNNASHSKPTLKTANDPGQTVPYIAAHDNMTLFDIISRQTKAKPDLSADLIHRRIRIGNFMLSITQGVVFFHAGQELGRTKQYLGTDADQGPKITEVKYSDGTILKYVHDSYDSSDAINQINWGNIVEGKPGRKTMLYTKGLIALRKSTTAFRQGTRLLTNSNVKQINFVDQKANDLVIGFSAKGTDATYYVFVNTDLVKRSANLTVDITSGEVLVDENEAGILPISTPSGFTLTADKIEVEPLTGVIIKM
ncbi:MAG TPA: pullulanase-associated domain-containing protein [Spirochaetota bacterium]|jgi:secreted pullulanase|nr:MAG: Pullulanase precursor [Spirochaetes bacterium ADurb.Bin133]HNZ27316.1 pullulanase-associated domain-containing protein [Spirochaetota bacterium]